MNVPTFVVVGGMLGAGKTSLIVAAARRLVEQGRRVGVVTNDQGSGLVDTALVRTAHVPVAEVAGGCFCCRLSDLLRACDALAAERPEVIFAEPVGSCVDLAATVLRPLLRDEAHRFRVAPLTVLVDPARAIEMTGPQADADVAYLFRHQLDEADIVCFTKADAGVAPPALDGVAGHAISAKTGQGVEAWLDHVLAPSPSAGSGLIAVDYSAVRRGRGRAGMVELARARRSRIAAVAGGPRWRADRPAGDIARRGGPVDRAREGAGPFADGLCARQRLCAWRRAGGRRHAGRVAGVVARPDDQRARHRRPRAVVAPGRRVARIARDAR